LECTKPLEAYKINNLIKAGRVSIGVHCNGEKKWSLFVSALIKGYEAVIVLTRPVQRGEIITRQHLAIEKKDISSTKGDYATVFEQVENKQAARNMPAGAILGTRSVVEPAMIKRKDKVIIRTGQAAFLIEMSGIALMDGIKGQIIRVKNESSGRIITGTVLEPGVVLVK
jgi:flagella basal body P-ring formation protein FlgA